MALLPPGLQGNFTDFDTGGASEWMDFKQRKAYTNVFIVHKGQLLLGYKKRGFGKDQYNGFGGKVEVGETSMDAALRELQEEAGISAQLEHAGVLLFVSEGSDPAFHIEIYRADGYAGVITESEEMRPQWFKIPSLPDDQPSMHTANVCSSDSILDIPYDKMWDDDRIWLPLLLCKRPFAGRVDFSRDGDTFTMQKWWFGVAEEG